MRTSIIQFANVTKTFRMDPDRITTLKQVLLNLASFKKQPPNLWTILDDVSFEISKGEFVGIMGRNGAGKSTILKLICGIYQPNLGKIKVEHQIAPLIELGAGFVGDLNGTENIYLNASILGYSHATANTLIDKIIAFSELGEHIHKPVKNYSSGMVVRLAFSIAAHVSAPILIFDEVLAVGDIAFQQKCLARIRELHKEGRTVILVTHDPGAVRDFCDRCIVIDNARKVFDGSAQEGAETYTKLFS